MRRPPHCEQTFRRLQDHPESAYPGGFETKVLAALAHLREAYFTADSSNRPAVEQAIVTLAARCEHIELARAVLDDAWERIYGRRLEAVQ